MGENPCRNKENMQTLLFRVEPDTPPRVRRVVHGGRSDVLSSSGVCVVTCIAEQACGQTEALARG